MSLEQSIADLITVGTKNLALPQTIANLSATVVTNIGVEYQNRVANLATTFYVSATGDNAASGLALDKPLFSLDEALRRTPRGGLCKVYLCSNFGLIADVDVDGRDLIITSPNATRYALGFDRTTETISNTQIRSLRGFALKNGGRVRLVNVGVQMPAGDGVFLNLPQDTRSAVFKVSDFSQSFDFGVGLYYCDIAFPDNNFGPMLGTTNLPTSLIVNNCTITGQAMAGKWLYSLTAAGGTASSSLPWLRTNLANV